MEVNYNLSILLSNQNGQPCLILQVRAQAFLFESPLETEKSCPKLTTKGLCHYFVWPERHYLA